MHKIKFIYFDIGGVLNLDFTGTNKWSELKADLGVTEATAEKFEAVWQKHRKRICIDCDIDSLIPEFQAETGIIFPAEYSMLDDFVKRFELNPSIWPVVKKAEQKYKVGILSNMYPRMFERIQQKKQIPTANWDVIIKSNEVGFQKPDPEIYEIAEQKASVDPSQIFFTDNLWHNTEVAKQRGWQTYLYDSQNPEESNNQLKSILDIE